MGLRLHPAHLPEEGCEPAPSPAGVALARPEAPHPVLPPQLMRVWSVEVKVRGTVLPRVPQQGIRPSRVVLQEGARVVDGGIGPEPAAGGRRERCDVTSRKHRLRGFGQALLFPPRSALPAAVGARHRCPQPSHGASSHALNPPSLPFHLGPTRKRSACKQTRFERQVSTRRPEPHRQIIHIGEK